MYIYSPPTRDHGCSCKSKNIARLQQILQDAPLLTKRLYDQRLASSITSLDTKAKTEKERQLSRTRREIDIRSRRMGVCHAFDLPRGHCDDCRASSDLEEEDGDEWMQQIHCVYWEGQFYITLLNLVKTMMWRVQNGDQLAAAVATVAATTRPISKDTMANGSDSLYKFIQRGISSDLRQLRAHRGDFTTEEAKSDFLVWLCRHGCIRTMKKQKVYCWKAIDFESLFVGLREKVLGSARESGKQEKEIQSANMETTSATNKSLPDPVDHGNVGDDLASWLLLPSNSNGGNDNYTLNDACGVGGSVEGEYDQLIDMLDDYQHRTNIDPKALVAHCGDGKEDERRMPSLFATATASKHPSRSHRCSLHGCTKAFKRKQHLQRHLRTHTGERPFICLVSGCGRAFSRGDNLRTHMKNTHSATTGRGLQSNHNDSTNNSATVASADFESIMGIW